LKFKEEDGGITLIKMDLRGKGCEDGRWIEVAQ
jgi:hypothetical protein